MRSEVFYIQAGVLHRDVQPVRGQRYIHTCNQDAFMEVARNIAWLRREYPNLHFTGRDLLRLSPGLPFTQVYTALAFMKERGCVIEGVRRHSQSATDDCYLDAMTEWYALEEKPDECDHSAGNIGYSNRMIFCLDCDGVLKNDASYQDYEQWAA